MSPNLLQMTSNVLIRTPGFHLWASGGAFHGALSLLTQLPSKPLTIVHRSLSSSLPNGSIVHHYRIPDSCSVCGSGYKRVTGNAVRNYSASPSQKPKPSSVGGALQESSESGRGAVTLTTAEKVKENVKTASYGGVIIVGVLIGGAMLYYVLNELFSSESPNNIYSHAFKMCKLSTEVQDALGSPIKCYGEETRRGWRRHVAFQEFLAGETKFIRMRFYIEGQFKKATVNVEKKTNDRGRYEYTYISVDVDGYPPRRIEVPF